MSEHQELWALRMTADAAEVWTENGRIVAQFKRQVDAEYAVDDHNIGVEINRPDPPEVVKSLAEKQAERLAAYRREEPDGARLLHMIRDGAVRAERLLGLKAPEIIVSHQAEMLAGHIATFRALHPMSLEEESANA